MEDKKKIQALGKESEEYIKKLEAECAKHNIDPKNDGWATAMVALSVGAKEIMKLQSQKKEQLSRDPYHNFNPPNFEITCEYWLNQMEKWTLSEGANLLAWCNPNRTKDLPGLEKIDDYISGLKNKILRATSVSLIALNPSAKPENYEYEAIKLVKWAIQKGIKVPKYFIEPTKEALPSIKKTRPSQQDKELCRDIARELWRKSPNMTIQEMCSHPAIKQQGNGALYTSDTIRKWIRDLCPNPQRGRPRKK